MKKNLGLFFNSRRDRNRAANLLCSEAKRVSLKLKTRLCQLLGFLRLDGALLGLFYCFLRQ